MERNGRYALISVTDKRGVVEFARGLGECGYDLLSSGGTARVLAEAGLEVTKVGDFTGSPEILGGRVKTLHPRVHGGILARASHTGDAEDLRARDIPWIDVVAVNLYRFEEAAKRFDEECGGEGPRDVDDEALFGVFEQIDIGGPTLLRAAAKNASRVAVVVDPDDYSEVLSQLRQGSLGAALRGQLAAKAFRRVAEYDLAIDAFLQRTLNGQEQGAPVSWHALLDGTTPRGLEDEPRVSALRYGENPHQAAYFLRTRDPAEASVAHARVLQGKALSYNNLLDAEAALELVKRFAEPAAVVIKHTTPCGTAVAETLELAFERAYAGDPVSAFGGILALNRPLETNLAESIATKDHFFEVVVAPEVGEDSLEILRSRVAWGKNLRVLACGDTTRRSPDLGWSLRTLRGGLLCQQLDREPPRDDRVATKRTPSDSELRDLELAWKIVQSVRSNAIVLVREGALVGAGGGQTSRVDSVEIAVRKAGDRARGAVLASDAFFPFRDGVDRALAAGVRAFIQPGGSRRDAESIAACDESEAAMVFTGIRHFLH